ncbi:MAG: ATP-binding protein [Gammaproteobacteria bacterium]|nr:ATP-binding protein [Gammaproteobacteria bacterium]
MGKDSLTVTSKLENLSKVRNFVKETAKDVGLYSEGVMGVVLAVDEACANIIQHGYVGKAGEITITIFRNEDSMIVSVSDNAPPYNPLEETPVPDLSVDLSERAVGGMGVLIIKQNTDFVEYKVTESGGNALIMTKQIKENETGT